MVNNKTLMVSDKLQYQNGDMTVTKQQALARVREARRGDDGRTLGQAVERALAYGNPLGDVALQLGWTEAQLVKRFPSCVAEAGRISSVRLPHQSISITDMVT